MATQNQYACVNVFEPSVSSESHPRQNQHKLSNQIHLCSILNEPSKIPMCLVLSLMLQYCLTRQTLPNVKHV